MNTDTKKDSAPVFVEDQLAAVTPGGEQPSVRMSRPAPPQKSFDNLDAVKDDESIDF